ncbi:hypothetical protein Sfulv_47150 [Streptomyces fulvorobeus]|uniref:ABC transporter substrate-binding protein n=1 Tax=Streptomyces fulvorobeus TaxID=284028 RepID=A0A7J0CDN7_9ACTN|nr:hypothetical protein Sfulv_47150 [Streptomyces fulvorobeus]
MLGSTRVRRHTIAASATAAALALVLGGCSSGSDGEKKTADSSAKGEGAFPVSVKSALGTAKIDAKPERVVTLGQGSAETAIALGTTPWASRATSGAATRAATCRGSTRP